MNHPREHIFTPPDRIERHIASSDKYLELRRQNIANSLAETAKSLIEDDKNHYSAREKVQLQIYGHMPDFLAANIRLDKDAYASRDERKADVARVLPYNHALRQLIDENSQLTMPDVLSYVRAIGLRLMGPEDVLRVQELSRRTLNGMRHEIAAENTFWQIPEVENVEQSSNDQDANGIDLIVTYRGYEIPIDVKASQKSADKVNHSEKGHPGYALCSGFTDEDFGLGFRASKESTDKLVPEYQDTLDRLINSNFKTLRRAG